MKHKIGDFRIVRNQVNDEWRIERFTVIDRTNDILGWRPIDQRTYKDMMSASTAAERLQKEARVEAAWSSSPEAVYFPLDWGA